MVKFIPIKAQAGFSGFESTFGEFPLQDVELQTLLIDKPIATYIGYAEGHSMTDVGIFSGDLLIISRAEEVRNNDIIVANLNGVFVVKQVDRINNKLLAAAEGYPDYTLTPGDEFQVEGVVTRSIRMIRPLPGVLG